MKNESGMKTAINEKQTVGLVEIHETVLRNIKSILEEAGISVDQEIIVKEVRGEDSNSVFRIDCGESSYALKVFSNSKESGQFCTNKMFNRSMIENHISTPKIIHPSDQCDLLPYPWIVWEWFSGEPSCGIESETERQDVAVKTGIELRKIHEIKMPGFGRPTPDNQWSGENIKWTIDFFANRIKNLVEQGGIAFSDYELLEILSVTSESKELLSFNTPRLIHGDITGGNVLVADSGDITFIDPGEIISGDPMSDLGYSQTTSLSPIFREGVWEGYTKDISLTDEEYDRFLRWRLLRQCIIACRAVLNKNKNAENYINDARSFLKEIKNKL